MIHRVLAVAAAAVAAVVAWRCPDSVTGSVAWTCVCAIACAGFGVAIERVTGQRKSAAVTVATGLAVLLMVSLGLARIALLAVPVMFAALGVGVALTALARPRVAGAVDPGRGGTTGDVDRTAPPVGSADARAHASAVDARRPDRWFALWITGAGALLVVVLAKMAPPDVYQDGWNQTFAVKRLWDQGFLGHAPHESGLALIGQAYAALFCRPDAGGVFRAGLCAALLMFVVACELVGHERRDANLVLALVVIVIVVRPTQGSEWLATVLHLSAILTLRTAAPGRVSWHTLIAAIALGLVRTEYWLLAVPYAFAAIMLPRRTAVPRTSLVLGSFWVICILILLALGVGPISAILRALPLVAAWPLALVMLRLLGTYAWRSAIGAMCGAMAAYQLGLSSYAVAPAVHVPEATFSAWLAVALIVLISSDAIAWRRDTPYLRIASASLVVATFAGATLIYPSVKGSEQWRTRSRFSGALLAWSRGNAHIDHRADDVRAMQLRVPAGARIAFWGRAADQLDFKRNPIRDVWASSGELVPATPSSLRSCEWLIVENIAIFGAHDPWLGKRALAAPTQAVNLHVDLVDSAGSAQLYRLH